MALAAKSVKLWNNEDENWMQLREEAFPEITFENSPWEVELTLKQAGSSREE